ncbi:type II secretion system secretin GspD [Sphingomonas sp. BT-65]|uniref:type II secretion system secretin GspD n=1 Tax=Sphingomonas sp. BT-65 TaxID=2989821 RepID=UPI002236B474|nr:type II secretion system secretin GspD [Sphingomonas sp. BT-65]MCW4460102.1 type II secretion system secretin GspD [Sphingomonas sp. BT-65]
MPNPIRNTALTLALVAMTAQPILAQESEAADIVVNMRGVEIADVADQISRLTGRTLILDPAVKGTVTVTSASPLSPSGVWELFLSVLRANGFAAVRSGRAWRIVPAGNAVRDGGVPSRGASGQELITRMIRLSNVPSAEAARVARPLVASFGSVEPLAQPNAVVVTDYADNVRRIEGILRALDGNGSGLTFATIALRNGSALDVAQALQGVLGDPASGGARVAADARSNTVIVRGTPTAVADARRMIASLDAPGGATPMTRVFRLNYADAESVTEVLRGVLGQEATTNNAVARSLSDRRGGYRSPTSVLGGMVASGGSNPADTAAAAASAALQAQQTQLGQQRTETPQGFSTPELTVQPSPDINAVVVRGTPSAIATIEPLITDLDVRRPQVLIEAAIAEITGEEAEALAVQLGTSGAVLNQIEGAATSFSNAGPSLGQILDALDVPFAAALGPGLTANIAIGDSFSILVQALGTSSKSNLLSTPQITTLDNKVGEFVVAQEVPFVTGSILPSGGGDVNPYTSIERKDVGITLKVLPRINAGDTIRLEVAQEASSIAATQLTQASDLITNRRAINTTVLVDNGQTIVLGGLTSDDYGQVKSQVPILGDIPILGELFKSRRESRNKRTLFIFLKPTILRNGEDAAAMAKAKYARLRSEELDLNTPSNLLLKPLKPRLTLEIDGIY